MLFGETEYIAGEDFDEEEERGGWDNKLDFLFSCISVSVGLGSKYHIISNSMIIAISKFLENRNKKRKN